MGEVLKGVDMAPANPLHRRKFLQGVAELGAAFAFEGLAGKSQLESAKDYYLAIGTLRSYIAKTIDLDDNHLDSTLDTVLIEVQRLSGYSDPVPPARAYIHSRSHPACKGNRGLLHFDDQNGWMAEVCSDTRFEKVFIGFHEKLHTQYRIHRLFEQRDSPSEFYSWDEALAEAGENILRHILYPQMEILADDPSSLNLNRSPIDKILAAWLIRLGQPERALAAIMHGDNDTLREILNYNDPVNQTMLTLIGKTYPLSKQYMEFTDRIADGEIKDPSPEMDQYNDVVRKYLQNVQILAQFVLNDQYDY